MNVGQCVTKLFYLAKVNHREELVGQVLGQLRAFRFGHLRESGWVARESEWVGRA